jgi:hypothetical protein
MSEMKVYLLVKRKERGFLPLGAFPGDPHKKPPAIRLGDALEVTIGNRIMCLNHVF